MSFLSRWWLRSRFPLLLALISVGLAVAIVRTQGQSLVELYYWVSLPLRGNSSQQQARLDAKTLELQQQITDLKHRNQSLRTLLEQPKIKEKQAIVAAVIGRSADHWWQQILVGKGKTAGIQPGDVAVAPGGLVGRVTDVSPHTSRVLLISDPSSRIGVTVSRSRHMGILRGQTGRFAVLEFFESDPDVKIGDAIVTSTLSRLFPPSLPIGTVQSVNESQTANPQAIIELSVPIAHLEWISIYAHRPPQTPIPKAPPASTPQP